MADKYAGGIRAGSTSVPIVVQLRNLTDNLGTTGKVAANFALSYQRAGSAAVANDTAPSDLAAVTTAYVSGGLKEIDAVKMPGAYLVYFDNNAFPAGVEWVLLSAVVSGTYGWSLMVPLTTNAVQTGDSFPRIGAPTGASIAADIQTRLATAGYTAPDNADVITALADLVTLLTRITAIVPTAVQVRQEMDTNSTQLTAIAALFTTALAESYATVGATMTPAQALYEILGLLSRFSISGTTLTLKKKDAVTTAATYTLDSGTAPTTITRSS